MSYAPDESKISIALLGRFLTGECTAEEAERVRGWMESAPMAAGVVEVLARYRANRVVPEHVVDVDALWRGIQSRIRGDVTVHGSAFDHGVSARENSTRPALQGIGVLGTQPLRRSVFKARPLRQILWPALCGMVASAAIFITMWRSSIQNASKQSATAVTTYLTRNSQRAEIRLPDGSRVELGVASRLEVPGDYLAGDHTVRLVGEALFTVVHETGKPFTVLAGPTVTQVLGTNFLVRRYATDTTAVIAVREGKVATYTAGAAPTVVTAARQMVIDRTGMGQTREMDPALFSFATGVLTLKGGSLLDVIPDLDRWYDVDIRLGDPTLATHHMKAELSAGSAADLVGILEGTFEVRVVRDGRVLTLFPR